MLGLLLRGKIELVGIIFGGFIVLAIFLSMWTMLSYFIVVCVVG